MRAQLLIFLLLALVASLSAWPAANSPPSCLSIYSLFGYNFTYTQASQNYSGCNANTIWGEGILLGTNTNLTTLGALSFAATAPGAGGIAFLTTVVPNNTGKIVFSGSTSTNSIENFSVAQGSTSAWCLSNPFSQGYCTLSYTNLTATTLNISNTTGGYGIFNMSGLMNVSNPDIVATAGMTINYTNASGYFELASGTGLAVQAAPQKIYESINTAPGTGSMSIVRSDFNGSNSGLWVGNTSPTFRANLYYQTSAITPQITFFPNAQAIGDYYNNTDLTAYLYNNSPAYVLDRTTQQWYLVPAVQTTNNSNVLLISVVLVPGGSASGNLSRPYIPNILSCYQQGDQYIINTSWPTTVSNLLVYQNSTVVNTTANSSATFFASINTTVEPIINYSVNGNTTCARNSASGFLPLAAFNTAGLGAGKYIIMIFMLLTTGISVVQPFALLFPVGLNDIFGIITPLQMGLMCALVITVSIIINGFERVNTVKGIVVYTLLLVGIMTQVYLSAGINSTPIQNVGASFAAITTNDPTLSPWNFLANSFGFIINIFLLVLSLPAIAVNAVLGPTCQYVAPMCGPATSIGLMAILGLVAWVWLKSYEVETNKFRDV